MEWIGWRLSELVRGLQLFSYFELLLLEAGI
jgi:hypothetical protein